MAERYISREWLLKALGDYKDLTFWTIENYDAETVLMVLQVVENLIKGAPAIGPRQYGNKTRAAKNAALKFHFEVLKKRLTHDNDCYVRAKSVNNALAMGFYKGRSQVEAEIIDWLERMVEDG